MAALSDLGRTMRAVGVALVASFLLSLGSAPSALADCTQVGTTVTCSGNSPAGFAAGQDGLSVTVQSGATVGTGLTLNDNNQILNLGTVAVGDSVTAIAAGNNNQIVTSGAIVAGNDGIGASITGTGSIQNSGTVTVGDGNSMGLSAVNVTNTGTITTGDFGFGIHGTADSGALINRGTIAVGSDGAGIQTFTNLNTITNTGTITFGGCGYGISALGSGNTVVNSGTLAQSGCGAGGGGTGIFAGDSGTVTNSGTITVGDNGGGILSGVDTVVINSGRITAGADGFGINASGNVLNTGTIVAGDSSGFGGGIIGLQDGVQIINTGTIMTGIGTIGIGTVGNAGVMGNTGSITVGRNAFAILGQGDNIQAVNSGTIVAGRQGTGIGMIGNNATVLNGGTVTVGDEGTAIGNSGANATLSNSGTLTVGNLGNGMVTQGANARLTNTGTITAGSDTIGMGSTSNNAIIVNSGTVTVGACGHAIDTAGGSGAQITNSGKLTATGCGGTGVAMGTNDTLTNSGTIIGSALGGGLGGALTGAGGGNTIVNSGILDGPITFTAGGNNTLTNSGTMTISTPLAESGGVFHTLDGVFTQTAQGILGLRVGTSTTPGTYDSLTVFGTTGGASGTANLGGTLRALVQPGLYGSATTYSSIVTFTTSTGAFSSVQSTSPFFTASAVYTPGGVDLVLTRLPFNALATGGVNGRALGNILEANYSPNLTGALATFYGNLLGSTSPTALSQLAGEVSTAAPTASFAAFGQYLNAVFSQTSTARNTPRNAAQASGSHQTAARRTTTAAGGTRLSLPEQDACDIDICDTAAAFGLDWTYWAQGFGSAGRVDANPTLGTARVNMTTGGGATGIDVHLNPNFLVGLTLGTASSGYVLADTASSGTASSVVFGVYSGYSNGPAYLDAALAYGYGSFTTQRFVSTGTMNERINGATDGSQYGGQLEGGWRFALGQSTLTPFAGLAVQALRQNGYTETSRDTVTGNPGILSLIVQPQTTVSVRSTLGGQFGTSFQANDDTTLSPRLRLGWAHEFNTERTSTAALNLLPGATFTVTGAPPAADALIIGLGLDIDLSKMIRVFAQFDGDFASTTASWGGSGGIRLFW
ncbi:MAG: autotransporter domain-containing protein [Proteobacteria bacterium]|nr:autotransporter domain-containing protein [Pseudomonadota bacterium]